MREEDLFSYLTEGVHEYGCMEGTGGALRHLRGHRSSARVPYPVHCDVDATGSMGVA